MSVADQLKALVEDLGGEDADVGIPLPQIVAVVEQAERVRFWVEPITTPETPLGDALDALDEALTKTVLTDEEQKA